MYNLDNITVGEFWKLNDEYLVNQYLAFTMEERYGEKNPFYLNPKDSFAGKQATPLGKLTFGEVANIKYQVQQPTDEGIIEMFETVFKVDNKTILKQDIVSFFYALNWIKQSIKELIEREQKNLSGDQDPMLEMAGVKRLVPFGELNTLKAIGQQFGKSPDEVENWSYNMVFSLMLHDKVAAEVQHAYNELKHGSKRQA